MPWTDKHLAWLVNSGKTLKTACGKKVPILELRHTKDETILSAWAKHFRNHYCLDTDIDILRRGTPHSRADYLRNIKFPDRTAAPGPSIRSGDLAEILVADYVQYVLQYWVPRTRYGDKTSRNESTKGTDILGFKILNPRKESRKDTLALFEAKAQLATAPRSARLQEAVNDSVKDEVRKAESLNAVKQRLFAAQDAAGMALVERFQDPEGRPYTEEYGAVAVFSSAAFVNTTKRTTDTSGHPHHDKLFLLVIRGNDLMALVHDLYERAKLVAYFAKHNIPYDTRADHVGRTFFDLGFCPFQGPEHKRGACAVILNADGGVGAKCFHPECEGKGFRDIEKIYGPLNPRIQVGTNLERVVNQAIAAMASDPRVYQRGGVLVQIVMDAEPPPLCLHDNGAPRLRQVPQPTLETYLASAAHWEKWNARSQGYVTCTPPKNIVSAVDAAMELPGIRVIRGIIGSPALRSNGSILSIPGYDSQTGLFLDTDGEYPPLMSAREAIECLDDVLYDFPFSTPAHRSAAIASIVTLHARAAFSGPAPLFLLDANASRIGKGLFTDLVTMIYEGRPAARFTPPNSDDEARKVITSAAMSGAAYVLFDNIKDKFGGQALENAITTGRWCDRILGGNKQIDVVLNVVWLATSNNAVLTQDMLGRTCHIRLETKEENPELRTGFRYKDLLKYVKENRHKLAIAALSIPAAYIKAGKPDMKLPAWGGFQDWSDLVRNSLVWAGLDDPGATREALREDADGDDTDLLRQLMDAWSEIGFPATVAAALEMADSDAIERYPRLLAAIAELGVPKDRRNDVLGKLLRQFRGRVLGGRKFVKVGEKKWNVMSA